MDTFARCVKILIVEQLREPVGIFWTFIAPVLYLFYRISPGSSGFVFSADTAVADCLTYIAFFSSAHCFMHDVCQDSWNMNHAASKKLLS
ncbi:hypothetical protein H0A71_19405 [Alcaligenaceae bacterium]|nr:hypothetical protein [Alcaligenaceae bacterium]